MTAAPPAPTHEQSGPRVPRSVRWYRRISVKLALGLGLAMFSIQFFAFILIIETYSPDYDLWDTVRGGASEPYAEYLSTRLRMDEAGYWVPTDEAETVVETFLGPGETFVWLSPDKRVRAAGKTALDYLEIGDEWPLCDSREYCGVSLAGDRRGGSTWTPLGIEGHHIGTFVLVWFDDPKIAARLSQQRAQSELISRIIASAIVATLTSALLVSLVTRRLSQLAADASTPLSENPENVDLPGPFAVSGDDEIARLATALNTMRGRIEQLVGRLEDRDRQRREWIAQVSHDLRTPLTALSACLERAMERYSNDGKPHDRGLIEAIQVARQDGQRLQTLVDDLFELARLDAGEKLVAEPVPPGELVRQTVRGLRPLAEARNLKLTADVAPSLPTVRADGRRLMRALENMLRNAIHFAKARVVLSVYVDEGMLKFEVSDDGPGLPVKAGIVRLGQSDSAAKRPDSAGLGLIVTRRVATAHGGKLDGRNLPEGGAAVWIQIPIEEHT
ncbi:MAG: HAMP domain-containing histidine kinase [Phycisphaerales bacterium]|nr:HAMP domain-containing histidine kinase [Phycisphaerales bacterium]